MGKLESVLLKKSAIFLSGEELVLPFAEATAAILIATDHQIAVLGVDALEVQSDGLATVALFDPLAISLSTATGKHMWQL
jgi:hypothetical protein